MQTRTQTSTRVPGLCVAALTLAVGALLVIGSVQGAAAAGCHTPLAIGEASVTPLASGGSVLDITGTWGYDDVTRLEHYRYSLNVLVTQGDNFVNYPVGRAAQSGTLGGLTDGFQPEDITELKKVATADTTGELLHVGPSQMKLALPASIGEGDVSVVLYVVLPSLPETEVGAKLYVDGEARFLSNAVSLDLRG